MLRKNHSRHPLGFATVVTDEHMITNGKVTIVPTPACSLHELFAGYPFPHRRLYNV